jgi:hypothetical protein
MKESTLARITAAATAAKRTAQKALAASPNPDWTEHEMQSIDEWIARQDVNIERPEAIRRLVELGLTVGTKAKQPPQARANRAKELATKAIEKVSDPAAPPEERAQRRRQLTKGPSEFREDRVDLPKAKGKV